MPRSTDTTHPLPSWLVVLGSATIAAHFLAIIITVLAAPSGPWPSPEGVTLSTPPQFAYVLNNSMALRYVKLLRMNNDYHFQSNLPTSPGVSFEVRLKDESGNALATVEVPEKDANLWVRHRQSLIARGLTEDQPVMPPQGEAIPAPRQSVPMVRIWDMVGNRRLEIRSVQEHLVPRDRPVFRPSELSLLLSRSYARYLRRTHGAATAELIRHTQDPIPPAVLFMSGLPPAGATDPLSANFGVLTQ